MYTYVTSHIMYDESGKIKYRKHLNLIMKEKTITEAQ